MVLNPRPDENAMEGPKRLFYLPETVLKSQITLTDLIIPAKYALCFDR